MEVESKEGELPLRANNNLAAKKRKRRRCICLSVIAVILAVVIIIIILAFTVFKPKRPTTAINSTALRDFSLSLDIVRFRVSLNVTIDLDISINNPNKVGFRYRNSSAFLQYRGHVVGQVPLPAGKIGADGTTRLNLTLTILADRLLSDSNLYSDVISGTLPLTTYTRIAGRVRVLNMFNIRVVSYTTCDLTLNVSSRSIGQQTCKYRTKI